jgi:hypothetical protein
VLYDALIWHGYSGEFWSTVSPATPEYLKWSKIPITFDHSDHLDFVPKLRRYHLIVSPIVKDVELNRVLVDRGTFLNILFLKTFHQMGLFHSIVPGAVATPISQIALPVTFESCENFCTENLQFEVADLEMAWNAFMGWLALTKFMAIPHYAYLVLKVLGPHGVISIRGDIKHSYDCDKESCEMADRLTVSVELQELKKALAESPPPPDPVMPKAKTSKTSIQPEDSLSKTVSLSMEEHSKVIHVGNNLEPI